MEDKRRIQLILPDDYNVQCYFLKNLQYDELFLYRFRLNHQYLKSHRKQL